MRAGSLLGLVVLISAGMAQAEGLARSLRPMQRPAAMVAALPGAQATVSTSGGIVASSLRPLPRPVNAAPQPDAARPDHIVELVAVVAPAALRPQARPVGKPAAGKPAQQGWGLFKAAAIRTQPGNESILPRKGSVCGDPAIRGETMAPITARVKGCGVAEPVRVTAIAGVRLSQPATIDCATASALKDWVKQGLQPAFGRNEVVELQVAGHYVCRPRNSVRGNRISEHGRGKAIDISGFTLANGQKLSVAQDWRRKDGRAIKAAHKAACGIFGTTLGPGSDSHHEDHLHFDTAKYRNGSYCR